MSEKEMIKATGADGVVTELDWHVLRLAIETLQKLAPPETRKDPIFLDKLYEVKQRLRKMFEAQVKLKKENFEKLVKAPSPEEDMKAENINEK